MNAKVIVNDNKDKWFKWTGDDTYVVQVGDQIDRCRPIGNLSCKNKETTIDDEDSDLEIMLFYDSLDKIAIKKNGRVFKSKKINHNWWSTVSTFFKKWLLDNK